MQSLAARFSLGLVVGTVLSLTVLLSPSPVRSADLDLSGTTWQFDGMVSKLKARAKKIGRVKTAGSNSFELRLLAGDLWEADIDGSPIASGSYVRKQARLILTIDETSPATIAAWFADAVEAAAALEGVDLTLSLDVTKLKTIVLLKAANGIAQIKLRAKVKLAGTASGVGLPTVPGKVAAKLKGESDWQLLQ